MRTVVMSVIVTVLLAAIAGAVLTGRAPGGPLREGPLIGHDGVTAAMPVRATDTGVLWGILNLENRSGSPIVIDSVAPADNEQDLPLLTEPYIWDDSRVALLNTGSVDAHQLPLPANWKLPAKHKVKGYVLESGTPEQIERGETEKGYDGPSAEVLFEFAVPKRPSTIRGITVKYHIGSVAYRRTFDTTMTFCPWNDQAPCKAVK